MIRSARLALALTLLLPLAATAEDPTPPPAAKPAQPARPAMPPNMESYQLVLLKRGPAWTPEVTPAVEELQKQHLGHLQKMAAAGHMVIAGPFSDQQDVGKRGACLYRVGSVEEARALAEQDPAVRSGRLVVEVVTWWVEKGHMTFPKAPPRAP
jgi:uncharacterized protein YciI